MYRVLLLLVLFSYTSLAQVETTVPVTDDTVATEGSDAEVTNTDKQADKVYRMNYWVDVPIVVVGGSATLYSFSVIYKKTRTPEADILALDKKNIPSFDRWATEYHNTDMDKISYYPFYAVMPLPLILLADKKIRKDAGRVGLLYLEAFAFTGVVYGSSVYFVDRYRPDVYNTSLDMEYRTNGNYRNSFFAGHVAVIATSTFFIAKVFDDYHPNNNWKWALYGGAAAATLGMGYMRLEAGKHFPSDILLGSLVGAASGILTPALHKNKSKKPSWSVVPDVRAQGSGLTFTYKL